VTGLGELIQKIERVTGNVIVARDLAALKRVVEARISATHSPSLQAYVDLLQEDPSDPEWRHLVSHITVKESYLFRGHQQFEALASHVLPQLARALPPETTIRVWSAGCARGEEAATLAIVLAESQHLAGHRWTVLGTDVDLSALEAASSGRFGARAVSHVPPPLLERYFIKRGREHELKSTLRERIEYRQLNLIRDTLPVEDGAFHLILLRNVLIYFRRNSQRRVLDEMARALAGPGWLFLGPTEAMWAISKVLLPRELPGCYAYQHPISEPDPEVSRYSSRTKTRAPARDNAEPSIHRTAPAAVPRATPGPLDLANLVGDLRDGNYADLRDRLHAFMRDHGPGPEAYLLLGMSYDQQGDTEAAVEAYRGAVYLRPDFFHGRFFLAESLRGLGWLERAVGEYRSVIGLLSAGGGVPSVYARELALPDRAQVLARSLAALEP
jgi:chemotaxis protein methyltransferase CheR